MIATRMAPAEGMAGELVAHVLDELPTLTVLDDRDRLLAAAWLASLRSARTRSAYAGDLLACRAWLTERGLKLLVAGWVPDVSRSSNRCLAPAVRACEDPLDNRAAHPGRGVNQERPYQEGDDRERTLETVGASTEGHVALTEVRNAAQAGHADAQLRLAEFTRRITWWQWSE